MGKVTGISWADSTANLWIGCQKVSPACDHCYAEELMGTEGSRFKRVEWGPNGERTRAKTGWLDIRRWQRAAAANGGVDPELGRRRRIFVNSLSDFFDNHRSVTWRPEAWDLIRDCPDLIFLLVTKRPQLIGRMLPEFWDEIASRVWLLTTAETQEWANRRVPTLLSSCEGRAPAGVFGVSIEPLLGPVDLLSIDGASRIGWIIVGGESGKEARPMHPAWVNSLRIQAASAGVPFHFKQWGEWLPTLSMVGPDDDPSDPARRVGRVHAFGRTFEGEDVFHFEDGQPVYKAGKHNSGNLLGGKVYEEVPGE